MPAIGVHLILARYRTQSGVALDSFSLPELYHITLWMMVIIAPVVFLTLLFTSAPYGRHVRPGWGPTVRSRTGWVIMEAPASLVMLLMFALVPGNTAIYLFLLLWQVHYFHRAFIYPFTTRSMRRMPVAVVLMAVAFNIINAGLNGFHFVLHADLYSTAWLLQPNFIAGLSLFALGFWMTKRADNVLRNLREQPGDEYRVPEGFLYSKLSCPNYLGEIIQWLGWALMTLSPAGWVFLLWTVANLVPRAISHHRWYRVQFPDYPEDRKAVFPYVL